MVLVNSDKGQDAFRYLDPPARLPAWRLCKVQAWNKSLMKMHPCLKGPYSSTRRHRHALACETKPVDRNRDRVSTCTLTGDNATNDVHLPHQPAAKNISGWIGVTQNISTYGNYYSKKPHYHACAMGSALIRMRLRPRLK